MSAAACRGGDSPGGRTLRAGILPVASLDPLAVTAGARGASEALVERQVLEGLVGYEPATMRPRPALARSWTASGDATTFTFVLRDGAVFHDGSPVTPQDVAFSLTRLVRSACAPKTSPLAGAPFRLLEPVAGFAGAAACEAGLSGVTPVGRRTVVIRLDEPWADLPSALGHPAASIVPRAAFDGGGAAFAGRPVGSGPYRVVRPWDGRALELQRFGGHWAPADLRPDVPTVRMIAYEDESSAYLDLLRGSLDYAPVPANRAAEARRRYGEGGFVLGTGLYFFGFNLSSPRVASPDVRRALSLAIDRASLARAVFKDTRDPAVGVLPVSLPGAAGGGCDACGFDAGGARDALAAAGLRELRVGVSSLGSNPQVGQALAGMFEAVGVAADVVERPIREHLRALRDPDTDVFQLGIVPEYPAADAVLWPLVRSSSRDNAMGYSNADVDRLLEQARRTVDGDARARLHAEAERALLRDLPLLPLLWFRTSVALDGRLRTDGGSPVDATGGTDFARIGFAS